MNVSSCAFVAVSAPAETFWPTKAVLPEDTLMRIAGLLSRDN